MKVTITYYDHDSLSKDEVIRRAEHNYGKDVDVKVEPESNKLLDQLYFFIQNQITHEQIAAYFDEHHKYPEILESIKAKLLWSVLSEFDKVVKDNETRVT